jgi:fructosamine-3-kinase
VNAEILAAVAEAVGSEVVSSRPVSGGDINNALRVTLADGRTLFVKHRDGMAGEVYRAEAKGLRWLADADAVRIPHVVAVGEGEPAFLALEWMEGLGPAADHDERLGRGLAALHRAGADHFGGPTNNWIATLPQPNEPCATWPEFYAERRLKPLARRAVDEVRLPGSVVVQLDRLAARLPDLCGAAEPPSRLHGDLWGGNAITGPAGEPVLIDPAAYGGHREVDLAMMRLFGGFSSRVFDAYAEAHPLSDGFEDRVKLYQLYPLLVHVLLFGGSYSRQFASALARYAP